MTHSSSKGEELVVAWLVEWRPDEFDWVQAFADEPTAADHARKFGVEHQPLVPLSSYTRLQDQVEKMRAALSFASYHATRAVGQIAQNADRYTTRDFSGLFSDIAQKTQAALHEGGE